MVSLDITNFVSKILNILELSMNNRMEKYDFYHKGYGLKSYEVVDREPPGQALQYDSPGRSRRWLGSRPWRDLRKEEVVNFGKKMFNIQFTTFNFQLCNEVFSALR